MKPILDIAEHVARQYVIGTQTSRISRISTSAIAGVIMLIGCFFVIFAGYFWLTTMYFSHIAALVTGLVLIRFSVLLLAGLKLRARAERKRQLQKQQEMIILAEEALGECCKYSDEATDYIKQNPKQSLLFATLAGFIASRTL
jgi:hypothetical protein